MGFARYHPVSDAVRRLYGDPDERQQVLNQNPALINVWGFEKAAVDSPLDIDYLDERSPYYPIKCLSTKIYREQLARAVTLAPSLGWALDAGCGIGRSTILLAEHFQRVTAFDPCRANVRFGEAHLRKIGHEGKELHWDGMEFLDTIPDQELDFVLALEFVCYTRDPEWTMAVFERVLKPGGAVMLSVEATPGALLAGAASPPSFGAELFTALAPVGPETDHGRFVRYFDKNSLAALCRGAGLDPVRIIPSHFFGEGPFWHWVDDERLRDERYLESVAQADSACRRSPDARGLERVLTAVAIKPRKA